MLLFSVCKKRFFFWDILSELLAATRSANVDQRLEKLGASFVGQRTTNFMCWLKLERQVLSDYYSKFGNR